jgi:hypothetical protein
MQRLHGSVSAAMKPVALFTKALSKLGIENSSVLSPNGADYTSEGREP